MYQPCYTNHVYPISAPHLRKTKRNKKAGANRFSTRITLPTNTRIACRILVAFGVSQTFGRMEATTEKKGISKEPAYLSTHPADAERIAKQKEWMDSAIQVLLLSACLPACLPSIRFIAENLVVRFRLDPGVNSQFVLCVLLVHHRGQYCTFFCGQRVSPLFQKLTWGVRDSGQ